MDTSSKLRPKKLTGEIFLRRLDDSKTDQIVINKSLSVPTVEVFVLLIAFRKTVNFYFSHVPVAV